MTLADQSMPPATPGDALRAAAGPDGMPETPRPLTPLTTSTAQPPPPASSPASLVRPSLVYAAIFGSLGAFLPYVTVFYGQAGLGLEVIGVLSALAAGVSLVAAPAWGAIADRMRDVRVPLLLGGLAAAAAGTWLASADDPLTMALAVAVLSAGTAGLAPMLDSRTVELLGADRDRFGRARAWGSIAFIASALVTGQVIVRAGAVGLFLIYVPGLAITGIAAYLLLGGGPRRSRVTVATGRPSAILDVLRSPELGLFFGISVLLWTAVSAVMTFSSIHLIALGGDGGLVGALWSLSALVEVPLMFAFPLLVRRVSAERLLVIGALAFGVRALGWALAPVPELLIAVAPIGGIGFAFVYVGTVMVVARRVPPSVQATAQGLFSGTTFSLGSIFGAMLGGQLAQGTSIAGMFAVAGVLTLLSAGGIALALGARRPTATVAR